MVGSRPDFDRHGEILGRKAQRQHCGDVVLDVAVRLAHRLRCSRGAALRGDGVSRLVTRSRFLLQPALDGVDLDVAEHQVVALIGASGSGKSTLLRCVDLREDIDAGQILLDGGDISDPRIDADQARQAIGIVFQSFNLFPHMTALANVTLAPRVVHKSPRCDALARGCLRAGAAGGAAVIAPHPRMSFTAEFVRTGESGWSPRADTFFPSRQHRRDTEVRAALVPSTSSGGSTALQP